jgi:hypothetical protein
VRRSWTSFWKDRPSDRCDAPILRLVNLDFKLRCVGGRHCHTRLSTLFLQDSAASLDAFAFGRKIGCSVQLPNNLARSRLRSEWSRIWLNAPNDPMPNTSMNVILRLLQALAGSLLLGSVYAQAGGVVGVPPCRVAVSSQVPMTSHQGPLHIAK